MLRSYTLQAQQLSKCMPPFKFEDAEVDRLDILIQKLQEYCSPRKNVTVSRYYFNTRNQISDEKFDTFLTALKNISQGL